MNQTAFPTFLCVILYFSSSTKAETDWSSIIDDFEDETFKFMVEACSGMKPFEIFKYTDGFYSKPEESNNFYAGADGSMCSQSNPFFAAEGTDLEVMFSAKKYSVGDSFEVSFVDVNNPESALENKYIEIESAMNWTIVRLVMSKNHSVKVKMKANSIRLDRVVAVNYVKVHRVGSPCIAPNHTTEDPSQTTEESTETTQEMSTLTTEGSSHSTESTDSPVSSLEFEKFKDEVFKWMSISTVAVVVSIASMTMSICVCMFHVKSPTNYECKANEESVVVQTGVSRMVSNS